MNPLNILAPAKLREYLQYKAFVFPEKSKGSYIVALIHNPDHQLSFSRAGDGKWIWLPPYTQYEDCSYSNGLLYAITKMGAIHAFDISGPVIMRKIIMGVRNTMLTAHTWFAPWGDLLNVWRTADEEDVENAGSPDHHVPISTSEIEIDKVDITTKRLEESKCLHDHVLFLGHNISLCLSAKDHPHLKANHVYFTDNNSLHTYGFKNDRRDIGIFNLESNSWDELVTPQPWSNWPTPMWITLNLAKMKMK